jgi:hemerythrin superfamily protein
MRAMSFSRVKTMRYKSNMCKYDAVELLTRDQAVITQLFQDYERLLPLQGAAARKAEIVAQLCLVLTVHSQVEEDIFYPAVLDACGPKAFTKQILLDHVGAQELVARLVKMKPGDTDYDATVAVLHAYVAPHMVNERECVYPKARSGGVDMFGLGQQIHQRQKELYENVAQRRSRLASDEEPALPLAINVMTG